MGFITPLGQPKATSLLWRAQRLGLTDPLHRSLVAPYLPGGRVAQMRKNGDVHHEKWCLNLHFTRKNDETWWNLMGFDKEKHGDLMGFDQNNWGFNGTQPYWTVEIYDSMIFVRFSSQTNHYKRKTQGYSPAQIEISTQRCVKPITWRYEYAPYKIVIIEWEYCPTEMAGFFAERILSFPEQNRGFNAVKWRYSLHQSKLRPSLWGMNIRSNFGGKPGCSSTVFDPQ